MAPHAFSVTCGRDALHALRAQAPGAGAVFCNSDALALSVPEDTVPRREGPGCLSLAIGRFALGPPLDASAMRPE